MLLYEQLKYFNFIHFYILGVFINALFEQLKYSKFTHSSKSGIKFI